MGAAPMTDPAPVAAPQLSGPRGIMRALTINAMFGFCFILTFCGSVTDFSA